MRGKPKHDMGLDVEGQVQLGGSKSGLVSFVASRLIKPRRPGNGCAGTWREVLAVKR